MAPSQSPLLLVVESATGAILNFNFSYSDAIFHVLAECKKLSKAIVCGFVKGATFSNFEPKGI